MNSEPLSDRTDLNTLLFERPESANLTFAEIFEAIFSETNPGPPRFQTEMTDPIEYICSIPQF